MNQLSQSYATGESQLLDVPVPSGASRGALLIRTAASLVSVGTEKAMIDVAQKSLIGKALARPDWVKQVIDKVRTEGLAEAYRQSTARLDMPVPLGYASAGIVQAVGAGVRDFAVGDRVACSGSGFASHAELASVPRNLCCPIPDGVSFDEAAFAALGGIALEAVRLARVELGHRVAVIGLGLLGQLAVQILVAAGCHVLGIDVSASRNELALAHGAEQAAAAGEPLAAVEACRAFTSGHGADAVIILASTPSNEPLNLAAELCRERGRIVATGLVGLDVPRKPFYEKEIEFTVSRAWGPGLYDEDYEGRDVKYPLPYVRWTAQRNMAEFLELVARGRVKLDLIITHRYPFAQALEAYSMILEHKEPCLGVILQYPLDREIPTVTKIDLLPQNAAAKHSHQATGEHVGVGLIGAGLYARGTLLPALSRLKSIAHIGVATSTGLSGQHVAQKWHFGYATTDYHRLLDDEAVDAVLVLTRHASHAHFVCRALAAGKAVFVEKPLAINPKQLADVVRAHRGQGLLTVGYNRRFAPDMAFVDQVLGTAPGPSIIYLRANAGSIPAESWVHHPDEGGGRIIGELCHFVDLASALCHSLPVEAYATEARTAQGTRDNLTVSLRMADGSAASLVYASTGDKAFPREYVEVFRGGAAAKVDNFRGATVTVGGRSHRRRSLGVDRGHSAELRAFVDAVQKGSKQPVPLTDYVATTLATFAIEESLTTRAPIPIHTAAFVEQALAADLSGADA